MGKIRRLGICTLLGLCVLAAGCGKKATTGEKEQMSEQGRLEPVTESETADKAERIICWGDSLTYGHGGDGVTYPSILAEKTDLEVINYGNSGETARQIATRMGLLQLKAGAFEIPANTEAVGLFLWQDGEDPLWMRYGDSGINPCKIGGVEGTLSYNALDNMYYFTRSEAGEAVTIAEGTDVVTYASTDIRKSDIIILFAGTNLPPDKNTVGELIDMEQKMLDYLGSEKYVVIGLTSKELIPDIEPVNEALSEAFGEHFLDIREYLLENGLSDAGIQPTKQDQKDMENGEIPTSLRVDEVHGNSEFYRIIGEQVYEKLDSLGYLAK